MKYYYALFSGGLDSTLAILLTVSQMEPIKLTPLFFKYGQKSEAEEARAVHRLMPYLRQHLGNLSSVLDDCREFDIRGLFSWSKSPILKHNPANEGSPDVENRNMILIGCAASIILADWKHTGIKSTKLIVGFKNEHYDTKRTFARAINRIFETMNKPISVDTPLIAERQNERSSPKRLAKCAYTLGAFDLLKESWSCYYPQDGKPCSSCSACQSRQDFFTHLRKHMHKERRI